MTYPARAGRLIDQWAADHTHGLAGSNVILALDMYEHSYHLDYGDETIVSFRQAIVTRCGMGSEHSPRGRGT